MLYYRSLLICTNKEFMKCSNHVTVEIQGQSKGQKGNPINNALISNLMNRFGILVQFPVRIHVLKCSLTYRFCAMGIFKKALHLKIDVFVKFESAINLEIRGQIKKNWIPSIWVF